MLQYNRVKYKTHKNIIDSIHWKPVKDQWPVKKVCDDIQPGKWQIGLYELPNVDFRIIMLTNGVEYISEDFVDSMRRIHKKETTFIKEYKEYKEKKRNGQ